MKIKQLFMTREGETERTTYGPIRITKRCPVKNIIFIFEFEGPQKIANVVEKKLFLILIL